MLMPTPLGLESSHTDVSNRATNDASLLQRETAMTRHGLTEAKVRVALTAVTNRFDDGGIVEIGR